MTIKELLLGGGGLLLILMTLVQIAPIKINPWTALAKAIGKAVNADVFNRLSEIESKLDEHIKTDAERLTTAGLKSCISTMNCSDRFIIRKRNLLRC